MALGELEDLLGFELMAPEGSHVETLSGLIQATLGTLPEEGTELEIQNVLFRITKVEGTRMSEVVMLLSKPLEKD